MSLDYSIIWYQVLKILSNELNNDMSFNTVLKPAKLTGIIDDNAVIEVPNEFIKSVIEKRYINLLKDILSSILKKKITVSLEICNTAQSSDSISTDFNADSQETQE